MESLTTHLLEVFHEEIPEEHAEHIMEMMKKANDRLNTMMDERGLDNKIVGHDFCEIIDFMFTQNMVANMSDALVAAASEAQYMAGKADLYAKFLWKFIHETFHLAYILGMTKALEVVDHHGQS